MPARMVEARLRVRTPGALAARLPEGAESVQLGTDGEHGLHVVTTREDADLDRVLKEVPAAKVLVRSERTMVVRIAEWTSVPLAIVRAHGGVVLWPVVAREGRETYTVLATTRPAVAALIEDLRAEADVEVLGVAEVPLETVSVSVPIPALASGLTQRQFDALKTALDSGYYELPRKTRAASLAASLDLSRSTFEEHLRKAERGVLVAFGDLLATHAGLAVGALKKAGRPKGPKRLKPTP